MKKLSHLALPLALCLGCGSLTAQNLHFFRNDGKYNVYAHSAIDTIAVNSDADLLDIAFTNTSTSNMNISAVDSIVFMNDTCLIPEMNIVTTDSATITRDTFVTCSISIKGHNIFPDAELTGRIRGRGNSTWLWYDKKAYRIKLDSKNKMLGLKKGKDWALMANYRDPTYLMNAFANDMGDYLDIPFSPNNRFCEVTLNGKFMGLYQLTEQIKKADNRVELNDSTGILLSLDVDDGPGESPDATDNFWATMTTTSSSSSSDPWSQGGPGGRGGMGGWGNQETTTKIPVCIKYPDDELLTDTRKQEVEDEFARLTTVIANHDYATFKQIMDVNSYIDFILVNEMTYNVELEAPRSMYLHRYNDKDTLWHMGPVWDFDGGFAFDWTDMYTSRSYFVSNKSLIGADPTQNPNGCCIFFINMFQDDDFKADFKARWNEVKGQLLPKLFTKLDNYRLQIKCSTATDEATWNHTTDFDTEFNKMKEWLQTRFEMEDTNINNM